MKFYPLLLDLRDKRCLVVGGGSVGTRKTAGLLECGAGVTVIEPNPSVRLQDMTRNPSLHLISRPYRTSDMDGVVLVYAASDDAALNRRIGRDAGRRGLLCNIADQPELGNFILPAVMRRGDLTIAISTLGRSPALAKRLRQRLEEQFGDEYAEFVRLLGAIRKRLLNQGHAPELHKPLFDALIDSELFTLIRDGRLDAADRLLHRILGEGYAYATLMQSGRNG